MKAIRMLGRNFRDAFKSVIRNFSLSAASISCITITLVIVAISMVLSYNIDKFTKIIKDDVTVVVFLETDVAEDEVEVIEKKINELDNVESYTFESKSEIADGMKADSEIFSDIIDSWDATENPLQDTYLVKVKDIEQIKKTADQIKEYSGVYMVKYGEGLVEQLVSVFKVVEKITYGTVIALILVTAFLISNTIKITIFSRRKEIEIMRLVGASNLVIKQPFVIEGLFLGFLGSIIPVGCIIFGYKALFTSTNGVLFSSILKLAEPEPFVYVVSLILVLLGILVGMFGSSRAVRKYLKI